jgi:hypothetical protein
LPKALVYTRHEGGVSVCFPTTEAMTTMTGRGGYWDDHPRSFLDELVYRKTSPDLQRGHHITEDAAWRFIRAMQYGGLSTREAYEVIAEHDCSRFGHLIELQDTDDLPDRWFRDAWRRSRNGGPPVVDLEKARPIQLGKIKSAVAEFNKSRLALGRKPSVPNWWAIGKAIRHATDENELRRVWPQSIRLDAIITNKTNAVTPDTSNKGTTINNSNMGHLSCEG